MTDVFKYICNDCGRNYPIGKDLMLCPVCREESLEGKPLKGVLKVVMPERFKNSKKLNDAFDIFDYLPVEREYFPPLPVGNTPLIKASNIETESGFANIYIKYDGMNPTGSYKDRASYLVSAFAKKYGLHEIVLASTGNAASSMAGVAAAAGQKCFIFMPSTAPGAKLVQCLQYGAALIPINGSYDKAFDLSLAFSGRTGFLNRNTAYNPMTIEGKKTAAFELVRQMSGQKIDYIFLPVGDGVILSGVIKGFRDLLYTGLINDMPKILGVQSDRSNFIYRSFHTGKYHMDYHAHSVADSINVDIARNAYCAISDLSQADGNMIQVSDIEIVSAQHFISKKTGIFCEPSSAVSYAGFHKYSHNIEKDANIVLLLTGNGLKDIETASSLFYSNESYEPDIDIIYDSLKSKNII